MSIKEEWLTKIFAKYQDCLEENRDLYAEEDPSFLFYFLGNYFSYLMNNDAEKAISSSGVKVRKELNKIVKMVGPSFLPCKQVLEDRRVLRDVSYRGKDPGIDVPKEPVIWAANHNCGFRCDPLATILAVPRNAYMLVGNPAQFYNTLDSIPSFINGLILVNRRNKNSRRAALEKCKRVIDCGGDIIIFPEGVLNKTPNALSLHLYSGVYQIAKEKNIKIVPIVHYKTDPFTVSSRDVIHTVVDDPIDVSKMSREEALTTLRDTYAYWKYLMMERYGQSRRERELQGVVDVDAFWEEKLKNRPLGRYDTKVERIATYYPKSEREYYQALEDIAQLEITAENVKAVEDAKKLVKSQIQRRV
jgi:1-acyl-sn-glycerol-3-phosphate acyltransferase